MEQVGAPEARWTSEDVESLKILQVACRVSKLKISSPIGFDLASTPNADPLAMSYLHLGDHRDWTTVL